MRKFVIYLLSVILIVLPLSSCNKSTGSVYYFESSYIPKSLDPQISTDPLALNIIYNINEGLFSIDTEGNIKNAVANGYTVSEDKLTYTVTINPDKKWEDGSNIVANDFIFAIKRILDKSTNSPYYKSVFPIKNASKIYYGQADISTLGVTAPDDYTLVFTLEKPDDYFIYKLATSPFFPCKESFFKSCNGKYGLGKEYVLSNSHFYLETFTDKIIEINKSEMYSGVDDTLPTSILFSLPDEPEDTQTSATSSNSSDYTDVDRIDKKEISGAPIGYELLDSAESKGLTVLENSSYTYTLCLNKSDKLFSNENARKAFMCSIDRQSFNTADNMYVANTIFPPVTNLDLNDFETQSIEDYIVYDPVKSKELYSEVAKQYTSEDLTFTLYYPDIDGMSDIAINIAQDWQEHLNAYINVEAKSVSELQSMFASGEITAAIMPISGLTHDAKMLMDQFKSDSINNIYQFSDSAFDAYANELVSTNSIENNETLLKQETLLYNSNCFYPLVYSPNYYAYNGFVEGVEQIPNSNISLFYNMHRIK